MCSPRPLSNKNEKRGNAMTSSATALSKSSDQRDPWRVFNPGAWCTSIDVRDFIISNLEPAAEIWTGR